LQREYIKIIMPDETRYYRHFKGGKYRVLAIGQDSESLVLVVIYQALYGDHKIWVRPKEMFDGFVERDGQIIKRFTEITKEEAYEK
jgi:Uncharacterized protein conserved in bacteria